MNDVNLLFKYLGFSMCLLMISACANTAQFPAPMSQAQGVEGEEIPFNFDRNAPLGVVDGSGADASARDIVQYGLAKKVSRLLPGAHANTDGQAVVFSSATPELYWFAVLGIKGTFQNQIPKKYLIRWFSPNGEVYFEDTFKASILFEGYMKTKLELPQPLDPSLIGRWRLRVWQADTLIDDRYFEIVATG